MTGNYLRTLAEHIRTTQFKPGVHHVEVRHDDDCGMLRGRDCDCSPTIESGVRVQRKHNDES